MSSKNGRLLFCISFLFIGVLLFIPQENIFAKTNGYQMIHGNCNYSDLDFIRPSMTAVKKIGGKYIKCKWRPYSSDTTHYYYSNKKKTGFKEFLSIKDNKDIATNGINAVYVNNVNRQYSELVCKNITTNSVISLHKENNDYGIGMTLLGANGNHIYYMIEKEKNIDGFSSYSYYYYDYDMSNKQFTKNNTISNLIIQNGNTAIFCGKNSSQVFIIKKLKSGKFKKVKTLGTQCSAICILGKKIYYSKWNRKGSWNTLTLIRCSINGKNKKIIGKFKAPSNGEITVAKITSKYCIIAGTKKQYKYIYHGGKMKKITKKKFIKELSHMLNSI